MTTKQPHGRLFELNISFLLRTSYRFPNGEHPIVLRLKYRGEKKDVNTGLKTLPENWLSGGGCVIPKARKAVAINQQLHEIVSASPKLGHLEVSVIVNFKWQI